MQTVTLIQIDLINDWAGSTAGPNDNLYSFAKLCSSYCRSVQNADSLQSKPKLLTALNGGPKSHVIHVLTVYIILAQRKVFVVGNNSTGAAVVRGWYYSARAAAGLH